jgi:hypothetical protein
MADTTLQLAARHDARVETFQRKHHGGLLALGFKDLLGSLRFMHELGSLEAVALSHAA